MLQYKSIHLSNELYSANLPPVFCCQANHATKLYNDREWRQYSLETSIELCFIDLLCLIETHVFPYKTVQLLFSIYVDSKAITNVDKIVNHALIGCLLKRCQTWAHWLAQRILPKATGSCLLVW